MGDSLLGGVFVLVVVAVVGYWWRRYRRQASSFIATEGWWWLLLVGMLVGFEAIEWLTAGAPAWVSVAGLLANAALWLGVLGPVVWRRFERRFPVGGLPD